MYIFPYKNVYIPVKKCIYTNKNKVYKPVKNVYIPVKNVYTQVKINVIIPVKNVYIQVKINVYIPVKMYIHVYVYTCVSGAQGCGLDTPSGSKNALGPFGISLKRCLSGTR